jgi:mycoredoxin
LRSAIARFLLILFVFVPLLACDTAPEGQHFARALGIERQLLRSHPEADYGHPGYISVLRSLKSVPRGAKDFENAAELAQRISDGRRFAASAAYPQIDHLPTRLEGRESPRPAQAGEVSGAKVAAGGRPRTKSPAAKGASGLDSLSELTEVQKQRLDITMYSTSWCGYCKKARRWLVSNGLPFVEKDVEKDAAAGAEFRALTGGRGGVPVITVGETVIRGFSERQIEAAIERAAKGS